jgi:hypothetical protein
MGHDPNFRGFIPRSIAELSANGSVTTDEIGVPVFNIVFKDLPPFGPLR